MPVLLGYAAGRQLPFNYWRAFGAVRFTRQDVPPLIAFVVFAPAWAWFMATFSGWLLDRGLGPALWLAALGLAWLIQPASRPRTL